MCSELPPAVIHSVFSFIQPCLHPSAKPPFPEQPPVQLKIARNQPKSCSQTLFRIFCPDIEAPQAFSGQVNTMMAGYARVSTLDQNPELQLDALSAAVLRREGTAVSDATVPGRAIRDLVRRGRMAPVSAFTAHSRRSRRTRRPQAVQVDTLTVSLRPGRTVRHFTAVDRLSRWGCGMAASNATAASAARFLDKLVRQAPFSVEAVQVDGGSEFMAEFEAACGDRNITLAVLPPKSPK